jgi:hypothetical protein
LESLVLAGLAHDIVNVPVGPMGVFVCPSSRQFLLALSGFANITKWSFMMQSTINEVVEYLFHGISHPVKVFNQECCEKIHVIKKNKLKYLKFEKKIYLKTRQSQLFMDLGGMYK